MIHPQPEILSVHIGPNTNFGQYAVVMAGAVIGCDCSIGSHIFIEDNVIIGDRVCINCGVYIWNGLRIENDVYIGPKVSFTNDRRPRSKHYKAEEITTIKHGAYLGAGTCILPGIMVGEYAVTGIRTVVTKDIPPYAFVCGNPGKIEGWVASDRTSLCLHHNGIWKDEAGIVYNINM